jgi:hypothetical protein
MEAITMSVSMNNKKPGGGGSKTQDQLVVWNGSTETKKQNGKRLLRKA